MGICCMAQETQTGILYQSRRVGWGQRWEVGSKGRWYMYTYGWFMLRFDRKKQNSVKQLVFNNWKKKKKEESACNAGDLGSIPRLGKSPGEENGNRLQWSCLENPMERAAWQVTVYGATRVGHDWVTKHSTAPVLEALENPLCGPHVLL